MATEAPGAAPPLPAHDGDDPVLVVHDLRKRYPKDERDVVDGLSFSVSRGEAFGLLGPNGAGKTTTIAMLTTRSRPTGGWARLAGVDVVADPGRARAALAVVPQRNNLDRSLSVRQNLVFHAAYHGVGRRQRDARADRLLDQFGLADRAGDTPDAFSGGQAQRVMIARALMHAPEVLFLDEPATGLDPAARRFVWDRVHDLKRSGTTVVITTHDMQEAEELCDRVAIMDHGKLLTVGEPAALMSVVPGERSLDIRLVADDQVVEACVHELRQLGPVAKVERVSAAAPRRGGWGGAGGGGWGGQGGGGWSGAGRGTAAAAEGPAPVQLRLSIEGGAAEVIGPVAATLASLGARLTGITVDQPSLEDVFIHHTGRALR